MREVHTNPQTTSAVCWAIFYICQQRLCPTPKATKDYISSMVYRIHRKANRVIRVGSFLGFFFSSPPYKMHHSINRKLKKKEIKKQKLTASYRILTEIRRPLSAQTHRQYIQKL